MHTTIWINQVLLYSTGNCIQYLLITMMEKNLKNIYIYIYTCVTKSLCCINETNTTLEINYTSIKKKKNLKNCLGTTNLIIDSQKARLKVYSVTKNCLKHTDNISCYMVSLTTWSHLHTICVLLLVGIVISYKYSTLVNLFHAVDHHSLYVV